MIRILAVAVLVLVTTATVNNWAWAQADEMQVVNEDASLVLKRKVAIARFTNETQSGSTFLIDESGDRIGKQASDILSARLAETNKFLMFERIDAGQTSAEQLLSGMKEQGVSVDYLIVGSVSEFGRSTESDTGVFSRNKIQKALFKGKCTSYRCRYRPYTFRDGGSRGSHCRGEKSSRCWCKRWL